MMQNQLAPPLTPSGRTSKRKLAHLSSTTTDNYRDKKLQHHHPPSSRETTPMAPPTKFIPVSSPEKQQEQPMKMPLQPMPCRINRRENQLQHTSGDMSSPAFETPMHILTSTPSKRPRTISDTSYHPDILTSTCAQVPTLDTPTRSVARQASPPITLSVRKQRHDNYSFLFGDENDNSISMFEATTIEQLIPSRVTPDRESSPFIEWNVPYDDATTMVVDVDPTILF
mmetsp:Transcript_4124/g.6262  ORF Transcript_4124/g.6262 Transcript_4124/m.6262 type:complete len:227 (+) Transcript_4124:49-729(+)